MLNIEELNEKVHKLRELKRASEDLAARIKSIEDEIKTEMTTLDKYELTGDDWKITWNSIASKKFSQSEFKEAHPDVFEQYLRLSESRRFILS